MSSPAQPKVLLRHSLYVWVLLAMVGILSVSFVVFRAISQKVQAERIDPVYDQFDELQLESARAILQKWGQESERSTAPLCYAQLENSEQRMAKLEEGLRPPPARYLQEFSILRRSLGPAD